MDVFDREARRRWLEDRKSGIGGSEIAGVLGISPWDSPAEVWARKRGMIPEKEETPRMRLGRLLEAPIAQLYAEREKVRLVKPVDLLRHSYAPLVGTPDRLVRDQEKVVEIKTADPMYAHAWGEDGSGDIPVFYATQCAVYMALTNYPACDVAVLFGTNDFRVYRLQRDLELENIIIQRACEFWEKYVVGGEEPPPDASKTYSSYIAAKYPSNIRPLMDADRTQAITISKLIMVRQEISELETVQTRIQNYLKAEIGDAEGIKSEYGKVVWAKVKDKEVVDWETIARIMIGKEFMDEKAAEEFIKEHTTIKEGFRRFNVYPAKGLVKGEL